MGCPKHSELMSLRAKVRNFESDSGYSRLNNDLARSNRKNQTLAKENDCLKAENLQLHRDNHFLKETNDDISQRYDVLVEKFLQFQSRAETEELFRSAAFIEKMDGLFLFLIRNNESLEEKVASLTFENQKMKSILNTDGTNSGTSTSKTPNNKDKVRPNSRKNSGKPRGGVEGHPKSGLSGFSEDEVTDHEIHSYDGNCPKCDGTLEDTGRTIDKDETDYEVKVIKRRHHFQIYRCSCCGKEIHAPVPNSLKEENQYGTGVQASALSLMNTCNVPINKTGEFIEGITDDLIHPSDGYLAKLQKRASKTLEEFLEDLRNILVVQPILYWDDTVIMVDKKRACLRFYGNEKIAYYVAHMHKDLEGIIQDEVLQNLSPETYVMHDHNTINYNPQFAFKNLECNVHLIRDCQKVIQILGHSWAEDFCELISSTIHERKEHIKAGIDHFSQEYTDSFFSKMDELIRTGREQNRKDRGSYYGNDEFTLLNRIEQYKNNYFNWVKDFRLPVTDSLSERALRGVKSKTKISGQFYSEETAGYYAKIRSYAETCRRNGINEIDALKRLAEGNPYTLQEIFHLDNQ